MNQIQHTDFDRPRIQTSARLNADALVIGFGKGGKTLAARLAGMGQKVVVAEASAAMYGGTCINIGCLPSKSLILSAQQSARAIADSVDFAPANVTDSAARRNAFRAAIAEKRRVTGMLRDKNYHKLADDPNVTVLTGRARFIAPKTVEVATDDGPVAVEAARVFINTGAVPRIPDIEGICTTPGVYTSTGLMELDKLPQRLVIIGGGFIGLEFASMFADFGSSVTVLQHGGTFLPNEDEDIAAAIRASLERQGVRIMLNADTRRIAPVEGGADEGAVRLSVAMRGSMADASIPASDAALCLTADAVLIATGRMPNIEGLGLDAAGVETTDRGAIKVDDLLRTTAPDVWALGDVNGGPQHTYISLDDYRVVLSQLNGSAKPYSRADRRNVPSSTFLHTPYSRVGLNEREARAAGLDFTVKKLPVAAVPKAQVVREPDGVMKAIVENGTDRILGAMLFAAESHEVINIVKLAMDLGAPAATLRDMVFTHPTMAEALNDLFA